MRFRASLLLMLTVALAVPARAADRPWVKFSVSLPAGDPTFNAFDPAPLNYRRENHDIRQGHPEGAPVSHTTSDSTAVLTPQPGRSWGARLRVQAWSPLGLDLSWVKEQRTLVQVWGSELVSVGTYHEQCPSNPASWCVDFGGRFSTYDNTYREHDLTLHVFRAGLNYDLLYGTKRFSLEPGIGLELSKARQRRRAESDRCHGDFGQCGHGESATQTNWPNISEQKGYVSLSGDVYPLGKRRFLALGASTRYLLASGDWSIRGGTLLENYEIPIRSRRWSTSFHATLAF